MMSPMNLRETAEESHWYPLFVAIGIGCFCLFLLSRWVVKSSLKFKEVVIVNTPEDCRNATLTLSRKCAEYRALGFDCEWLAVPSGRRPVALLQLASADGYCALIRLCKLGEGGSLNIPPELKVLLEDTSILKVGVVPSDDANYLFKDFGIVVQGCLDLRHIVLRNGGTPRGGLSGLAENILGVIMDKAWTIRCSNWEAKELSERQILYAANDAWYAMKIFEVLALGHLKVSECSILDYFKNVWRQWTQGTLIPPYVKEFIDIKFHKKMNSSNGANHYVSESAIPPMNIVKQKPYKQAKTRAFSTRQTPLYRNCLMQAPDGALLCTCDWKKAIWYVSKNLAVVVSEEPLTVRLKFEPAGRAVGTVGQFYLQEKANRCVVCGKTDSGIRKNIVPHEYRRHFPNVMKNHVSHDVLLLCLPCHLRSNGHDLSLKRQLAELCDAPFAQAGSAKLMPNREKSAVKAAAKALLKSGSSIPEERQRALRLVVKEYYATEELTDSILQEAATMNVHVPNEDYDPHGLKTVQHFSIEGNGGLVKLEQIWREHFLWTMNPQFMPNHWSVTHNQDRLVIRATENRISEDDLCFVGMKDCISLLEVARNQAEHRNTKEYQDEMQC